LPHIKGYHSGQAREGKRKSCELSGELVNRASQDWIKAASNEGSLQFADRANERAVVSWVFYLTPAIPA
jgi:hypothetical protein